MRGTEIRAPCDENAWGSHKSHNQKTIVQKQNPNKHQYGTLAENNIPSMPSDQNQIMETNHPWRHCTLEKNK